MAHMTHSNTERIGEQPRYSVGVARQRIRRIAAVALAIGLVISVFLGATQLSVVYLARVQPLRLRPAELHKLATLRNTTEPRLISRVSPDDTTIVTAAQPEIGRSGTEAGTPTMAFLNVEDGSSKTIDKAALGVEPVTDVVWRDDRTAVYLSTNAAGMPLLVALDRDTGAVISSTLKMPGRPLSLAPNASRALIEIAGGSSAHLATYELASGEVTTLLDYPIGGGPSAIAWTPGGDKLALVRVELDPAVVATPQLGQELAIQDALGQLPLAENPFYKGNLVDIFDLARHDFRPGVLRAVDGDGYLFNSVGWSTDGKTLVAQMAHPATLAGRRYPIARFPDRAYLRFYDAALNITGTLDRPEVESVRSSMAMFVDADALIIVSPAGMTFHMHYYNHKTGEFRTLPIAEGSFVESPHGYQVYATHRTRQLVFNHSSFQRPPELYRIGWDGSGLQPLTRLNERAAAASQVRVDPVSFPLKGGVTRTGYLIQPAGAAFPPRNARIVVFQQGGPGGVMANRWGTTAEEPFDLLPNFGIGVLVMSFSGREGSGPAFYNALMEERNFGQRDIDEAAQAVEYMIAQGYTARDRVGITGCSYGGYFTGQSIVRHPDLYAAANAQCSLLDLAQAWEFLGRADVTYWEGRTPETDPAEYAADSPNANAAKIRTPLLLLHGANDQIPASTVAAFGDRIAATGTPVELIIFKDEGHGLSLPSNKMAAAQAQIKWFEKYLAPGTER